VSKKIATREAYGTTLKNLGATNKDIVVLDADLSKSTKTADFAKDFPERFFNMGIAEQNLMGTAAGFAATGKVPFASTFAVFATGRAFEQIRNSIAYPKLNVKIAATHAGITVGEDGGSHQSIEDIAIMRALPNMTVIVPADAKDTEGAVNAAAAYEGPVYLRLGRLGVSSIMPEDYQFQIGKGYAFSEGKDATIIACGLMVEVALQAAEDLKNKGIEVGVINMATIKPIDKELILKAAKNSGLIITAEEHNIIGGLGGAVAEIVTEEYPVPVIRVGIKDTFGESGVPADLVVKYGLTSEEIVKAVEKGLKIKK
jgi:transketolase